MDRTKCIYAFAIFSLFIASVNPANILVLTFFSSKSHKLTYLPLIEELGKRGHNITMFSPVKPLKPMENVKEVFTMDIEGILHSNKYDPFEMKEKGQKVNPTVMGRLTMEICRKSYDLPHVNALVNEKFDLVFVQPLLNDCTLGLVYRIGAPLVLFTPLSVPTFFVNKVGGHFPPSVTPSFFLGYSDEMTFSQRFFNFGVELVTNLYMDYLMIPKLEKIYREKLGEDIPSVKEILGNASIVLSNGHFSLIGPRPNFPDVIEVGGIHSFVPAKPLPKDLENFISKGKDGFILFSMGSAIKGDMMPESKRKMILKVFSQLKQQVLWKWESESMPDLPKNVKLSKWLPQQDLLAHKDIKMFITHCGGGSTEESIYNGVPLVGIPMMGDQPSNANHAKKLGFLVQLEWNTMTEEDLASAIQEVLSNPQYRDNAKRLSTLFKDRATDPLETAVYWIEYVLRHDGAPHLRSVGRKLNVFQYHSIDVIVTYLVILGFGLVVLLQLIKLLCCNIFGTCEGKTPASNWKKLISVKKIVGL